MGGRMRGCLTPTHIAKPLYVDWLRPRRLSFETLPRPELRFVRVAVLEWAAEKA